MVTATAPRVRTSATAMVAVLVAVAVCALVVRLPMLPFRSGDYDAYVGQWYTFLARHGGFAGLRDNFANYNVPYLYLLAALTYLPIPALYAIKLLSIAFDGLLAFFTYRIVVLHRPGTWWPVGAAAVVLCLPTVALNSALWGQADSIYTALSVGGVYFLLRRRPWWACVFFGLAFGVKLQAIFLFPVLVLLAVRRWVPWRALLLVPATYLALDVPALLLGADPHSLFTVYLTETGTYDQLTLNAPNVYQFLGAAGDTATIRALGIEFTGLLVLALLLGAVRRRSPLTPTGIVLACAVSTLVVPYFLPAMHERYFYLADIFTVVAACHLPRRLWALPVLEQFASAFSYAPFLRMSPTLVPFPILATVMLAALGLALWAASVDMRLRIHAYDR
ncbi:MAG TPA: glycosyltransferase 87 family protein [Pseudonocardiaceae bacterium]|jgi:Gpi18-like mannosyltransferase